MSSQPTVAPHPLRVADLAAIMGRSGREFVASEFTWERVIERFEAGFAPYLG